MPLVRTQVSNQYVGLHAKQVDGKTTQLRYLPLDCKRQPPYRSRLAQIVSYGIAEKRREALQYAGHPRRRRHGGKRAIPTYKRMVFFFTAAYNPKISEFLTWWTEALLAPPQPEPSLSDLYLQDMQGKPADEPLDYKVEFERQLQAEAAVRTSSLGASIEATHAEQEGWVMGDYVSDACPKCQRRRLCQCVNGKHRCEHCDYVPEDQSYYRGGP